MSTNSSTKSHRLFFALCLALSVGLPYAPLYAHDALAPSSEYAIPTTRKKSSLTKSQFYSEITSAISAHRGPEPFIIGVAKATGTENTVFASVELKKELESRGLRVLVLPIDGFQPNAIKALRRVLHQIRSNIRKIRTKKMIRRGNQDIYVPSKLNLQGVDIVLLEHPHAISDNKDLGDLRSFLHLPLFLDARPELRYSWLWEQEQNKGSLARSRAEFQRDWEKEIEPSAVNAYYHLSVQSDQSIQVMRMIPAAPSILNLADNRCGLPQNIIHYAKRVEEFFGGISDAPDTKVAIVHDRDADGLISGALMLNIVRQLKPQVQIQLVATMDIGQTVADQTRNAHHLIFLDLYLSQDDRQVAAMQQMLHKPILFVDHHDQILKKMSLKDVVALETHPDKSRFDASAPESSGILYISPRRLGSSSTDSALYNTGLIALDMGGWLIGATFTKKYGWLGAMSALGDVSDSYWPDRMKSYQTTSKMLHQLRWYSGHLNNAKAIEGLNYGAFVEALATSDDQEGIWEKIPFDEANILFGLKDHHIENAVVPHVREFIENVPKSRWVLYEMKPSDQEFNGKIVHPARPAMNMLFQSDKLLQGSGRTVFLMQRHYDNGVPDGVFVEANTEDPHINLGMVMKTFFGGGGHKIAAGAQMYPKDGQTLEDVAEGVRARFALAEQATRDPSLLSQIEMIRHGGLITEDMMQYGLAMRNVLNPTGKQISIAYGAAMSDVIWPYLATNFSLAMFVDKKPVSLEKLQKAMAIWDSLPSSAGYFVIKHETGISSHHEAPDVEMEQLLIEELKAMGVTREDIGLSLDAKGRPQIAFRLPGDANPRRIIFQEGDITNPSLELLDEWKTMKIKIYLEKGIKDIQSQQPVYMPKIANALGPDGFAVFHPTDRSAHWAPQEYLTDTMIERVPNADMLLEPLLAGRLIKQKDFSNTLKLFGCDFTIWQKKESFSTLPTLTEQELNSTPEGQVDYVCDHITPMSLSAHVDASSETIFYEIARRLFPRAHELGALKVLDVMSNTDFSVMAKVQVDGQRQFLVKVYADQDTKRTFQELRWHQLLEGNGVLRIPRLYGTYRLNNVHKLYDKSLHNALVIVQEPLSGKSLDALMVHPENDAQKLPEIFGSLGAKMGILGKRFHVPNTQKSRVQDVFLQLYGTLDSLWPQYFHKRSYVSLLTDLLFMKLGGKLPEAPVLTWGHRDLHWGNVMLLEADEIGLIDFETMSMGLPETDVAKMDILLIDSLLGGMSMDIAQKARGNFLKSYFAEVGNLIDERRLLLMRVFKSFTHALYGFRKGDERRGFAWMEHGMRQMIPDFSLGKDIVHDDISEIRVAWFMKLHQLDRNQNALGLNDMPHYDLRKMPVGPALLQPMTWQQIEPSRLIECAL